MPPIGADSEKVLLFDWKIGPNCLKKRLARGSKTGTRLAKIGGYDRFLGEKALSAVPVPVPKRVNEKALVSVFFWSDFWKFITSYLNDDKFSNSNSGFYSMWALADKLWLRDRPISTVVSFPYYDIYWFWAHNCFGWPHFISFMTLPLQILHFIDTTSLFLVISNRYSMFHRDLPLKPVLQILSFLIPYPVFDRSQYQMDISSPPIFQPYPAEWGTRRA